MALLLDTCAGTLDFRKMLPLADPAVEAIDKAEDDGGVRLLLSPITAWEIGLLVSSGRLAYANSATGLVGSVLRGTEF